MTEALYAHIRKFIPLNAEEEALLDRHLTVKKFRKKEFLLKEGEKCTSNYFILKGCVRKYFIKENGQEQIVQFAIENWWITDYTSLEGQKVSDYYIQAIEDTVVAVFTGVDQELLFNQLPRLDRYFRLILQRAYTATIYRFQFLFDLSAGERYHHFNNAHPEFVQRIPQYMLASYLGFTPEVLSKIRAKK